MLNKATRCSRFVITGPTGWIGQALIAWLQSELGADFATRVKLFGSSAKRISSPQGDLDIAALDDLGPKDVEGAIVYHLAYLTRDKAEGCGPMEYATRNIAIDDLVLRAVDGAPPAGIFVASSGAASEVAKGRSRDIYGLLKLQQEDRFAGQAAKRNVPILNARIFNIAGPQINKRGIYALACFLTEALQVRRITIRAAHPVYRSYTHVHDLISIATASLLAGETHAAPIEIAGAEIVEMQDVARAAASAIGISPDAIMRPALRFDEHNVYVGEPFTFNMLAMKHGVALRNFASQVAETAAYIVANPVERSTSR